MSRLHRGSLTFVVALAVASALGGKPGGGGGGGGGKVESYPPVAPAYDFEAFESRPELGGVLDTETNIVWGYSMGAIEDIWNYSYTASLNVPGRYPACFATAADYHQEYGEYCLDQAVLDPARADQWEALAAEHLAMVDPLNEAGNFATQYSDWRLPTVEEAREAIAKGIFTAGEGGLNLWTQHPADATPTPPRGGVLYWTSTYGGKRYGNDTAFAYSAQDGGAVRTPGFCVPILVRTHTPAP
jgi:hypothetical protein